MVLKYNILMGAAKRRAKRRRCNEPRAPPEPAPAAGYPDIEPRLDGGGMGHRLSHRAGDQLFNFLPSSDLLRHLARRRALGRAALYDGRGGLAGGGSPG